MAANQKPVPSGMNINQILTASSPVRVPIGKDNWHAREQISDAIGNLNNAINGNLSFGNISAGQVSGNLKTQMFQGTSPASANTAFTLIHTLGKIPNGAILIQSNVAAILYGTASAQAWTKTTITLLLNEASVNYTILLL